MLRLNAPLQLLDGEQVVLQYGSITGVIELQAAQPLPMRPGPLFLASAVEQTAPPQQLAQSMATPPQQVLFRILPRSAQPLQCCLSGAQARRPKTATRILSSRSLAPWRGPRRWGRKRRVWGFILHPMGHEVLDRW